MANIVQLRKYLPRESSRLLSQRRRPAVLTSILLIFLLFWGSPYCGSQWSHTFRGSHFCWSHYGSRFDWYIRFKAVVQSFQPHIFRELEFFNPNISASYFWKRNRTHDSWNNNDKSLQPKNVIYFSKSTRSLNFTKWLLRVRNVNFSTRRTKSFQETNRAWRTFRGIRKIRIHQF